MASPKPPAKPTKPAKSAKPTRLNFKLELSCACKPPICPHAGPGVAKLLDEHAGKHAIERLVIVAPPKTLGDLRAELSSHTSALVAAEVAKDLTHVPVTQILDHLRDVPQF